VDPHHSKKVRGIMAHRRTCSAWQKHPRGVQLRLDHGGGFDLRWLIPRSVVWSKLERRGEGWVDQTPRGLVDPPFPRAAPRAGACARLAGRRCCSFNSLMGGEVWRGGLIPPTNRTSPQNQRGGLCVANTQKPSKTPKSRFGPKLRKIPKIDIFAAENAS